MRGNLADLAATGLASEPTLRRWIAAEPDQPWIIKRGSNGDAYEIDLVEAAKAFRAREEARMEAARRRAEEINQLGLDLGLSGNAEEAIGLSIAERRQLLEEEMVALKLGKARGELVSLAEAKAAFGDVLVKFGQRLDSFSARLAKKVDLERHQIGAIDRQIASDRSELADMMERMELGGDGATGGDHGATAEMEIAAGPDRG
ncbi:MAG: hypothetical protein QOH86_1705 [Sphingomonadales bacterium]|nr:hypothetical protein [Sphingomonadales bacterium]